MQNIYLVFRRDYLGYVTAWGFWLGVLSLPLLILFGGAIGALAGSSAPVRYYAVIEETPVYGPAIEEAFVRQQEEIKESIGKLTEGSGFDQAASEAVREEATSSIRLPRFVRVDPPARTVDELRPWLLGDELIDGPDGEKPLFAAIRVPRGDAPIEYWSENANVLDLKTRVERTARTLTRERFLTEANVDPDILDRADDVTPDVVQRLVRTAAEESDAGAEVTLADRAPQWISIILCYVLWTVIFSGGQYLLMGTIEERSNKIFDTLLTSVRLPQLLTGKLLAVLAVTMTMMGSWALAGTIAGTLGTSALPDEIQKQVAEVVAAGLQPSIVVPTLISLLFGYLMYGSLFIAMGSLCDTIQEAQTLLSPMLIILMLPLAGIAFAIEDPGSPFVAAAAWVPFFTPFLLILRMPTDPPFMEVLALIGLMAVTTFIILWLATKVYRAGAVHGAGISDAAGWFKRLVPGMGKSAPADETAG